MDNIEDMPVHTMTYIAVIFKNLLYLTALAFGFIVNKLIVVFPDWKDALENLKLVGGAVIVILVIIKLLLEIRKLKIK